MNKRTNTYRNHLIAIITNYGLTIDRINSLQEEIHVTLDKQKEKKGGSLLFFRLLVLSILLIVLKEYSRLSLSELFTPLIFFFICLMSIRFFSAEFVKSIKTLSSRQTHQLTFVYDELDYMKELLLTQSVDQPTLLKNRKDQPVLAFFQSIKVETVQKFKHFISDEQVIEPKKIEVITKQNQKTPTVEEIEEGNVEETDQNQSMLEENIEKTIPTETIEDSDIMEEATDKIEDSEFSPEELSEIIKEVQANEIISK